MHSSQHSFARLIWYLAIILLSLNVLPSCAQRPPTLGNVLKENLISEKGIKTRENQALELVKKLPSKASREELDKGLEEILHEIELSTRGDISLIREAVARLRDQPKIIEALSDVYRSTPKVAFQKRYLMLSIIGELQRPDALKFLTEVVWAPLPPAESIKADNITQREYEEILQSKAIQGIAFLRNDVGEQNEDAVTETINVMQSHPARLVRISSIGAYMWNHGNSTKASTKLYSILPSEYHPYVEMPRFYQGINRKTFRKHLQNWRKNWQ